MCNAATPRATLRAGLAAIGLKPRPNAIHTSSSLRSTSPAESPVAATPHRTVPCLVLFSPQGPRPLEGLKTVTLERPGNVAAAVPRGGYLRARGASLNRQSAGGPPSLSASAAVASSRAARQRNAKHAAVSAAARASHQSSSGIRCVYDRDTRSQLLHIIPGTEVDFSSCMRLPALAATPTPASGMVATPLLFAATAVHTIVVVQFCVAAPTLSTAARHQAGASRPQLPGSPIPPPGSFYIELVLRTGTSSDSTRGRGSTNGGGSSSSSGGYRLRFTNTGHAVQRHTHHTKIPLQCVRTAQWVQLFVDLEALLQSCKAAGAVVAGGTHCRLQQLRIGSGGSAASTGGVYVRRIIAGHGLPLPHPAMDHLVTADGVPGTMPLMPTPIGGAQEIVRDADREGHSDRRGSGTLQQRSSGSGSCWVPPEALRLPAEAGESLCVFVRTGDEHVLSEVPALLTPAEEPSREGEAHTRDSDNSVEATQVRWKANNCASDVGRGAVEWARDATQDTARRRAAQAVTAAASKPLTLPLSATLPPHQLPRRQPKPDQQQSPALLNSYRHQPESETAAARVCKRQPEPSKVLHHTALELLRMRDQQQSQPQPAHQFTGSGAAAHAQTSAAPLSPFFPSSTSPWSSPVDAASLSASDDAEMFVVREVSAAEQLAPATPPQYPANQLMTGKPPLRCTPSQPPVANKATHHALNAGHTGEWVVQQVGEDVVIEDAGQEGFSAPATVGATGLLFSTTSSATTTTATTSETSVLSVVSYSSAVELMDAMSERVRRIQMVLTGVEEEAAAAASIFAQPLGRRPPSRHVTPPPAEQGARPAVSTVTPTVPPLLAPPPPLTGAAATHSSPPPPPAPGPTAPAELMEAVLGGTPRDAVAATAAVPSLPPASPAAAMATQTCDSIARVAVAECAATTSAAPNDANAILELWSSAERPLSLPASYQRPATAAAKRTPLAERLRAHQASLSSSSSAASFSLVDGGDNDGVGDAPSAAIPPPTSAATSWTFHSVSLTLQTPSMLRIPATSGAVGEALPRAGGASSSYTAGAEKGEGAPLLRQAPRPLSESQTPAAEVVAAVMPQSKSSSGQVTKAVVWRRPVPVPGHSPSVGDATQRALQDEVRLTGTPLPGRIRAAGAESGGAGRLATWSARQNTGPTSSGMHTPLSAAVASKLGVAPQQESRQGFIEGAELCVGAQALPPPPSGRSFSTVSSFQMWLPSSSMPTLSASRGRYPSTITPFSGGGDRHCDPFSDSSSGAGGGPRPPRLGIAAAYPSAHPPMPHPSVVRMPQSAAAATLPTCNAGAAVGPSPLAQQQTLGFPAAAWTGDPPQHAPVSHHEAPQNDVPLSAKLGNREGRYMYDGVLQCYLDLETNAYVDKT
ncbi:conserved hypothetical protein [Leishmania major strain Friedlin]|uniref:CFA20 domain-containing protein n=1 Tax=Leishmania major TaxID=5664 RepID=Q4QEG3_LEIMA|nr:conserved hypothetical protein [Leishmania major strain Friedlin]CAG9572256.1 hypothetical_protein_-_conserved [Leishmania major strain Friedlin]CAJ03482.1 conserved hypothetical protein [Leishmania major strain Friedlin]|eukprot:XP_001682285.1 conserved hypothetical protein [Leishmania major strain Friedlin]